MLDINKLNISEKNKNILIILNHIINAGEAMAADIVSATGLSVATVSRTLVLLKNLDLVISKGKEITEMGRHPDLFSLNSKYGYLLHFYMGSDFIKGYITDLSGNHLGTNTVEIMRDITIEEFIVRIKACKDALVKNKKNYKKLIAASIAVPGFVDEKNKIIKRIPNIYNFEGVNLFDYLHNALQVPVIINNEARLSAVGEHIHSHFDRSNMIYIDFTKYRGIGAGIILEGQLFTGKNGFAGEVGDILVDIRNFDQFDAGEEGFLERMAGIGTLIERVNALMSRGHAPVMRQILLKSNEKDINLEMIERAVLEQDMDVTEVFDETMKMWTMAIINLGVMLDPELIILGGELNGNHTVVLSRIRHYMKKILYYDLDIRLSNEGENAQLFGGIQLLKKYVYNNILVKSVLEEETGSN